MIPEITLPTKTEIEKEFLVRLMANNESMKEAYGIIEVTDLLSKEAQDIYQKIIKLYETQDSWNVLIIRSQLKEPEKYHDFLFNIPQTAGLKAFRQLVKSIKSFSIQRQIYQFLFNNFNNLWDIEPAELSTRSLTFFSKLDLALSKKEEWNLKELLKTYQTVMDSRISGETTGITSGFKDLDYLMGQGFQRKDLIIVGARPSVGKTSFSLTIAHNAAKAGYKVLFITLEMDSNEILDRLLSFQTGIPVTQLIRGKIPKKEKVEEGYKELCSLPLSILHLPHATSGDVYAAASKHKYIQGLDLLVVDYLGYLSDNGEDEVLRLGRITKSLKTTANLLDCVVLAPHQLSRKIEQRSQERREIPMLSDLRDSGHIEQDADAVLFLNRDIMGEKSTKTTLRIGKNRTGETGIIDLTFNHLTTHFD